jgi:hypothetical protein
VPEVTAALALWAMRLVFIALVYLLLFQSIGALQRSLGRAPVRSERGLAYLVVANAPANTHRRGERFALGAVNAIGRDPGGDVVLRDDFASARHAVVSQDGEGWWLEDAGSTNGTFLNGDRVTRRATLRFGDEIEVGRVRLRFEHA